MSDTLYRKYRPRNFSEVIGQAHIVRTLRNSIRNGRIGHAYLFTGPRGTGKTSLARIFAKAANCSDSGKHEGDACLECAACRTASDGKAFDIIEIDAASNTGVDNIRELRETVAVPATSLKYKVYIIDEVHMLSGGAFNALLKTLEEPPAHVIFILATTEIRKVPETVISRCQRFDFARLTLDNIIEKLSFIAEKEGVKIDKEALEMIALASEGGMRDAESLLGQVISLEDKEITAKEAREIIGTTDRESVETIVSNLAANDTTEAIANLNRLSEEGYDLAVFAKSLLAYLRELMLVGIDESLANGFVRKMTAERLKRMSELAGSLGLPRIIETVNLTLEAQSRISSSLIPQLPLEIAFIKATRTFPAPPKPEKKEYRVQPAGTVPETAKPSESKKADGKEAETPPVSKSEFPVPENGPEPDMSQVRSIWPKLLKDIRPCNHSLSALLSNCQAVRTEGRNVVLATPYEFYRDKLIEPQSRLTVENVLGSILGTKVRIEIVIDRDLAPKPEEEKPAEPAKEGEQSSLLSSALEMMGGEVVEG